MSKDIAISNTLNLSRRQFLGTMGVTGLALVVGMPRFGKAAEEEVKKYGADAMPNGWVDNPLVFLNIDTNGQVTIVCHRSEMGQGVRTSLPMVLADELGADFAKVMVEQAEGNEKKYGNQDTDGSRSIRHFFNPMRRCGAKARMMLEQAAADQWGVPVSEVKTGVHEVMHTKSDKKLGFGELAEAAAKLDVPADSKIKLKKPSEYRYIGKGKTNNIDGAKIVSGAANYGIDAQPEGLLYAVVARPPVYGGVVKSFDDSAALKVPGVVKIVQLDGTPPPSEFNPLGGVAVVATNTWAAIKGREALKITWDHGANQSYDTSEYRKTLTKSANTPVETEKSKKDKESGIASAASESEQPGGIVRSEGDYAAAMKKASKTVKADYFIPHLAQAPMEPPMATAQIKDGHCEVWTCIQAPQAAHDRVAKHLKLKPEQVTVNVTMLGGGFGRKSKPDFVVEAALLSKAMDGKPVKVTWTREDDIHHGYYHTISAEHLEAGLDENGHPIVWLHRSVAPTIYSIFQPNQTHEAPFERGMGLVNNPFDIENIQIENPAAAAHARIGWFRSVSNIPHAFAIQSFVAEMAHAAGKDPKDYLLEVIGEPRKIDPISINANWNYGESPELYPIDTGRLRKCIETVAEKSNWGKSLAKGRGQGIAAHYSFVSYVAVVVEVEVKDGELKIPRVDMAIDCGAHVNPDRIRSQLEGACIMGISNSVLSEISFKDGKVEQSNFDTYKVARMNDAPTEIHVHLVESTDYDAPLGGVGEPGVPPMGPAICNAIFAATGLRIRQLPIGDQLDEA